jgi:hypothetical protein
MQLLRSKFQNFVAVRSRHREDEVGICGNGPGELTCRKLGWVATKRLKDPSSVSLNRMPFHRMGAGTGCDEISTVRLGSGRDRESLRRR